MLYVTEEQKTLNTSFRPEKKSSRSHLTMGFSDDDVLLTDVEVIAVVQGRFTGLFSCLERE